MAKTRIDCVLRVPVLAAVLAAAAAMPAGAAGPQGVSGAVDGAFYVTDAARHTLQRVDATGATKLVAGMMDESGNDDGAGSTARFDGPAGVAVDLEGSIYIADVNNHVIRKVSPQGEVSILAGRRGEAGHRDGAAREATFNGPHGVAVDATGNVYVADTDNSTIRKIAVDGTVSTLAGRTGDAGADDGPGISATFRFPQDLAADREGNVYVADVNAHIVRKIASDGTVSTLAGQADEPGSVDAIGSQARFRFPRGIAVDDYGNVYVADSNNRALRRIAPNGRVTTLTAFDEGTSGLPAGVALAGSVLRVTFQNAAALDFDLATGGALVIAASND